MLIVTVFLACASISHTLAYAFRVDPLKERHKNSLRGSLVRYSVAQQLKKWLVITLAQLILVFFLLSVVSAILVIADPRAITLAICVIAAVGWLLGRIFITDIRLLIRLIKEDDDIGKFKRKLKKASQKLAGKLKKLAKNAGPASTPTPA